MNSQERVRFSNVKISNVQNGYQDQGVNQDINQENQINNQGNPNNNNQLNNNNNQVNNNNNQQNNNNGQVNNNVVINSPEYILITNVAN
jgi:hypothetical protein